MIYTWFDDFTYIVIIKLQRNGMSYLKINP